MLLYNDATDELWMFYTARRGELECEKNEWYFGTQVGVAVSSDGGCTFNYKGELSLNFEEGHGMRLNQLPLANDLVNRYYVIKPP